MKEAVLERIREAGLYVEEANYPTSVTIDDAWRKVAHINVTPASRFPRQPQTAVSIHSKWLNHARENSVVSARGSLLVTPVVTGARDVGWIKVSLSPSADVSRLVDSQGHVEFVALSEDGTRLCAVTTEEKEVWVITLEIPRMQH